MDHSFENDAQTSLYMCVGKVLGDGATVRLPDARHARSSAHSPSPSECAHIRGVLAACQRANYVQTRRISTG